MDRTMASKQEPRVTVVVTPEEKDDVKLVVLVRGGSESDVMRERTIADIREDAARIREHLAAIQIAA